MRKQILNVIDQGADPSGRTDCTEAFKAALGRADVCGVLVPSGIYRLSGIISGESPPTFDPDDVPAVEEESSGSDEPIEPWSRA